MKIQCPNCGGTSISERCKVYALYPVEEWLLQIFNDDISISPKAYKQPVLKPEEDEDVLDPPYMCNECNCLFLRPTVSIKGE